ncbi:ISNCY family transposase [Brevibacillus marinus]|uniref:ISNCY family transposase n=1 Tax=Brevibacillus marinus TaxID=2496837 RepID=UPI001F495EE2|nr:ISNCY family transposase [Brevibacillus marinus]
MNQSIARAHKHQVKNDLPSPAANSLYRNVNPIFIICWCRFVRHRGLLREYEGIQVSPSTIRRIRKEVQLPAAKKRRPPQAHRPRERKAQAGMLIQIDASLHPWLEDRAPSFALLAAIDDATGKVVGALFRPTEDLEGYFLVMKQVIREHGIPMAVYSDRHTIFRSPKESLTIEQELAGEQATLSQFGQAMAELGITHSKARTPEAKGRIERLWQTLQDRLVIELRLRGVQTLEEANTVLPELIAKHNQRFGVAPAEEASAFSALPETCQLDHVLCYRDHRVVGKGETLSYEGRTYCIASGSQREIIPPKTRIQVRKTLSGELFAWYKGQLFSLREVSKTVQPVQAKEKASSTSSRRKPAANHPWRQAWVNNNTSSIAQKAAVSEQT